MVIRVKKKDLAAYSLIAVNNSWQIRDNSQLILKTKQINNFNIPQAPFCL